MKQWQHRLKGSNSSDSTPVKSARTRNQTGINQDDVRAALRLAKQQHSEETANQRVTKNKEHDNDEGFEETQSLMSESPSQGTSSDLIDSGEFSNKNNKPVRTSSLESKCTTDSTSASSTTETHCQPKRAEKPAARVQCDRMQPLQNRYNKVSIDRTNSARLQNENSKKSIIPRRSTFMHKTDSQQSMTNKSGTNVERSNSRTSLVSSRSSLNSTISTNTVKKMPLKKYDTSKTMPRAIVSNTPRKPLTLANAQAKSTIKRVPSGSTLLNQKPPLRTSHQSFMKPTTSSTTKTHTPSAAPSGRLLAFRAPLHK